MIKLFLVLEHARWTTNVRFFLALIASQVRIPKHQMTREEELKREKTETDYIWDLERPVILHCMGDWRTLGGGEHMISCR